MAILDLEQPGNRVIDIASPERNLIALLDQGLSQGLRLADLHRHDSVSIEAGPDDTVHRRRHRADDRVSNTSPGKRLSDVGHQQR